MKTLGKILFSLSVIFTIFTGFVAVAQRTNAKMANYEIQHNCKYDYNGLCYTEQERPWLF